MDDEKYYQVVADELRDNRIKDALWTKAIAKSQGDENKTKATYIQLRVEQLIQKEKRSRIEQKSSAPANESDGDEAAPESVEDNQMKTGMMISQLIIFVIGIVVIWKFLFPWVREMKRQMGE